MSTIIPMHKKEDLEAKKDLIKRTICKGSTDDELELFIHACKRTGLDPFMKQIYAVKRGSGALEAMTIQTGIDGLRLIADRSGNYAPGKEPTFQYDQSGGLKSATAYIKKRTADGIWHEVSATAFYSEYRPSYKSSFWDTKPHIMLPKCAEALALRKAFPAEMSGLYTQEEMEQANSAPVQVELVEDSRDDEHELLTRFCYENPMEDLDYFPVYVEMVKSKLQGRNLIEVIKGWIKDPEPCLKYYKNWLLKNKVENNSSQFNGAVVNI